MKADYIDIMIGKFTGTMIRLPRNIPVELLLSGLNETKSQSVVAMSCVIPETESRANVGRKVDPRTTTATTYAIITTSGTTPDITGHFIQIPSIGLFQHHSM
jgi:hypothetical protein